MEYTNHKTYPISRGKPPKLKPKTEKRHGHQDPLSKTQKRHEGYSISSQLPQGSHEIATRMRTSVLIASRRR